MTQRDLVIAEVKRLFGDGLESLAERLSIIDESDTPDFSGLDPVRRWELIGDGVVGPRETPQVVVVRPEGS